MLKDMTKGSPMRHIFTFAIPMLIGNIFQQLYNMVDSIVVGRFVGPNALAAVGTSFPVIMLIISMVIGLTAGGGIIISQLYGAKEMEKLKRAISTAFIFQLIAGIIITFMGLTLSGWLLTKLNVPPEVFDDSLTYIRIFFAGLLTMFAYNIYSGVLRSLGDSKTPLYFLIVSTVVNIVLDILFVARYGWGVAGVAWATVIAQGVSTVLSVIYVYAKVPLLALKPKDFIFDKELFFTMIRLGIPSSIQQSLASLGIIAVQGLVNSFGAVTMAAYTAAGRLDSFANMPSMNIAMSVSTFTGQNLGAGKTERVKEGLVAALKIMAVFSIFMSALIFMFGPNMITIFIDSSETEVIRQGVEYMKTVSIFYPVFGILLIFNNLLRGAGDTKIPMFTTLFNLGVRVVAAYYLASTSLGYRGIWISLPVGWCVGSLVPVTRYFSGKWKTKAVTSKIKTE
jgi:putative MATE family efflux protein